MNKVISFSLYGNLDCYYKGLIRNLEMKNEFYPDWKYRIYTEDDIPDKYINSLNKYDCDIIRSGKSDGHSGLFWRFKPLDEKNIDIFLVRDLDSRPSKREIDAVNEWINSDYTFHIIRDNKAHGVPILGGTWGAKSNFKPKYDITLNDWLQKNIKEIEKSTNNKRGKFFGLDQKFLRDCIWPLIKNDHMAHISDFENLKITGREIIMSKNEDNTFIGQSHLKNLNKKYE